MRVVGASGVDLEREPRHSLRAVFGPSRKNAHRVALAPAAGAKKLRIRIEDRALYGDDDRLIRDLHAFLRARDYFVAPVKGGLDVVPFNPLSERGDRERLERAIARWRKDHPVTYVEIIAKHNGA